MTHAWLALLLAAPSLGAPSGAGFTGATLRTLDFAVIGDSRPAKADDVANYPSEVIAHIYRDVEGQSPHPALVLGTGDYMNAVPGHGTAVPQIAAYLAAAKVFHGPVYPALGNHECANATSSECGPGLPNGEPENYTAFMEQLLHQGLGLATRTPYYVERLSSSDPSHPWTAKFVIIAANGWDSAQAAWLETVLAEPTTYTFAVRHERTLDDATCPGASASTAILARYPKTLLFTGHWHEFGILPASPAGSPELVVGNGGAPLTDPSQSYGYTLCHLRDDGAVACKPYDYQSNLPVGRGIVVSAGGKILE